MLIMHVTVLVLTMKIDSIYFLLIKKKLRGELYWYALRNAYDSTDNLFRHKYEVRKAFNRRELGRSKLMSEEEIEYLDTLPETLTIYRGMTEEELKSGVHGVSWTLKKETAEFFREKYGRNYATNHLKKVVHVLIIKKSKVIAFINGRNEFEIIYLHPKPRSK